MPKRPIHPSDVAAQLLGRRYHYANEAELQAGVEQVLLAAFGADVIREHVFNARNRIDFWLRTAGIGVECKVAGSPAAVLQQLIGYADFPEVNGLVLVTGRLQVASQIPRELRGKPIAVVKLWANSF